MAKENKIDLEQVFPKTHIKLRGEHMLVGYELLGGEYKIISLIAKVEFMKSTKVLTIIKKESRNKNFIADLLDEQHEKQKFLEEAQIADHCDHPDIFKIYETAQGNNILYHVMQFIPKSLNSILNIKNIATDGGGKNHKR